jgi:hypothetical protein
MLLLSTVWFDILDGRTFVTHSDDGLSHQGFKTLAQTVASALVRYTYVYMYACMYLCM